MGNDKKVMKLSPQAVGAVMMALQKCISEQTDITKILLNFELEETELGLKVLNAPMFKLDV